MNTYFPGVFVPFCNETKNYSDTSYQSITDAMVAIGITSDVFAIFGAIFIIATYFILKDLKTRARQILVIIAFADLFNAIFYLIGQTYFLANNQYATCYANKSVAEIWVCVTQATANNLFSLLSFSFTIILAVHIFFLVYGKNIFINDKIFWLALILGCGIPVFITLAAFWFGWFGPGLSVTIGWCFIRDFSIKDGSDDIYYSAPFEFLAGKLWDILTFCIITFIYLLIIARCFRKRHDKPIWGNIGESEVKLFLIPIGFVFLRIWGEIHLLVTVIDPSRVYPVLLYPQAVFEPGQGWLNAIIYILLTKNVRSRIFKCFTWKRSLNYHSLNDDRYSSEN